MAEIKNSFLKSKMNKDLDDRLIPNGEYRDAQNISVGKSEEDDIGSLENVLGNTIMNATGLISPTLPNDMTVIGYLSDEYSGKLYIFSTNYTDPDPDTIPTYAPSTKRCIIYVFTPGATYADVIVDKVFLNFSTTNPIQASLIENLLFFTDNRNPPRKVNISPDSGLSGYYTNEDQLSVAKYNPYLPINLFKKASGTVLASPAPTTTTFGVSNNSGILVGMSLMSTNSTGAVKVASSDYVTVSSVSTTGNITTITLSKAITAPVAGDIFTFLISTMTNKSSDPNWPGDPDYLESKFVRFSYRYRFDDGEYSLMAPFTQIAYIPKQKGYFINGNEDDAYRSTILDWMENNVNNVELLITLPCLINQLSSVYKISSIDILYKESDGASIKVLENLKNSSIATDTTNNIFSYNYQSRKPYKTLPSDQTTRVYDVVPVRALSQETAGNRIIYGNFRNAYTAPESIQYDVQVVDKGGKNNNSWVEYPNHSLKQNRNYQVGFVLCDKHGRTSPVILSSVRTTQPNLGSTLFSSYNSVVSDIKAWLGDTLQISVTLPITSTPTEYPNFTEGKPGLYAIPKNSTGFAILSEPTSITDVRYQFTLDTSNTPSNVTVPVEGDYLRGEYIDYVKVNGAVTNDGQTPALYTVPTDGRVNSSYSNNTLLGSSADIKFSYSINPIGWYSYKIVVKQTEQDYYNVYLPGILNSYPQVGTTTPVDFPTGEENKTANVVLINDNINKVPRDLNEVSDQQRQFRSSVQLHGRVQNNSATTNIQFFPGILTDTAVSIATSDDSNMSIDNLSAIGIANLYQLDTKPLIGRLSTSKQIGVLTAAPMKPFLAIYETDPDDSLLDIFWETNTVGLIADLNADEATGSDSPVALTADNFQFLESDPISHALTNPFWPVSNEGVEFNGTYPTTITSAYYTSIRTGDQQNQIDFGQTNPPDTLFKIVQDGTTKSYTIQLKNLATFISDSDSQDVYSFFITILVDSTSTLAPGATPELTISNVKLENVAPTFTQSTLPTISITVDEDGNPMPNQDTTAVNGSAKTSENQLGLKWSIVSGNPTGGNGLPSFQIIPSSGNITQIPANNAPSGSHTLVLKVEDAVDASGNPGTGSLATSPNKNQIINIGPIQANTTIRSGCQSGPIDMVSPIGSQQALITKYNAQYGITGIFYIADGTFTSTSPASGYALTDLPSGVTPSTAQTGDASLTNTMFKLGSALSKGTLSLSLNADMTWTASLPSSGLAGDVYWKVYHRTNSSSSWAAISDLNNTILDNTANTNRGLKMPITTDASAGPSGVGTYYKQFVLAYNQVGEYLVVASDAKNNTAPAQLNALAAWVNSNDLYYSTCVIENGVDFAPTVNPSAAGVVQSYQYKIGTAGDGGNSFFCPSVISSTTYGYSHVPYGKYVTQLYSTSTLTSTISFTDAGSGVSNYRAFITAGTSPYHGTDYLGTKFFFSTRFVATSAKVYEPNPWSQNYVQACSTFYGYPRSVS